MNPVRRRSRCARPDRFACEALEPRLLLSATVSGTIFNDYDGSGALVPGFGLANWRVYADLNQNGAYDAGEPTALSSSNGSYTLTSIPAGSWAISEVVPPGYYPSVPGSGSHSVTFNDGDVLSGQDFGNGKFTTVSGTIFNDLNGDGLRESSEPPLSGVTLYIDSNNNGQLDPGEPSSTSDVNGHYNFSGLRYGEITVRPVIPAGWQATTAIAHGYGIESGSDANDDWGFTQKCILGGAVYADQNANGMPDSTDPRLGGVTLYLDLNQNGKLDAGEPSTISQPSTGWYQLAATGGTYTLREVVPSGYVSTAPANAGYSVTLAGLESTSDLNFGNAPVGSTFVSGAVYNDLNGDAQRQNGEPGLPGVQVFADSNGNGAPDPGEPVTLTDFTGAYRLGPILPGSYTIREVLGAPWNPSAPAGGAYAVSLSAGQGLTGQDFGNVAPGSISGRAFQDLNGDGVYDPGDATAAGMQLYIDSNNNGQLDPGEPVAATAPDGSYSFSNLQPGTYILRQVVTPGWHQTLPGQNIPRIITLSSNQAVAGQDFGQSALDFPSISGTVFLDSNHNGVQDVGEPGVFGITVYIDKNNSGTLDPNEPWVTTDAAGVFAFTNLPAGNYRFRVIRPPDWSQTSPANNIGWTVGLLPGQSLTGRSFGLDGPTASVAGSVFNDLNADGVRLASEPGLVGVHVYIDANNDGAYESGEPTATTDAAGAYLFANLVPGTYVVRQVLPAGWARTTPLLSPQAVTVSSDQPESGPTFGDVQVSTVPMTFAFLLTLAQHYGQAGTFADGDLDGDGTVSFPDLLMLAQNYGRPIASAAMTARDAAFTTPLDPRRHRR